MANKYTRWAPTQYVPLPLNYYQAALMQKEQKTQQAADTIDAILAGYGAIQPFGADAQALYDETTTKLRNDVNALSKQNLDTPAAIRGVSKLVNDPNTVDTYEGIMMDMVYATKLKQDITEHRKKNPAVNTADLMSMLDKVELEGPVGDSSKFNRNRFRNVQGPTDYLDIQKKLEEGIAKLHSDSIEQEFLFGDNPQYIINGKITQLGEDKIRQYVMGKLTGDLAIQEQMEKNLRYKGYLVNHTNIDEGVKSLGQAYKETLTKRETQLTEGLKKLYGNLTTTQIEEKRKKDKQFRYDETNIQNGIKVIAGYKAEPDPVTGKQDWLGDKQMAYLQDVEGLVNGMNPYSWSETKDSQLWSPLENAKRLASWNSDLAIQRKKLENKEFMDALQGADAWNYTTRQSVDITDENRDDYIRKNVTELSKVKLNRDGMFLPGNYKSDLVPIGDGDMYDPKDVKVGWIGQSGKEQIDLPGGAAMWDRIDPADISPDSAIGSLISADAGTTVYVRKTAEPIEDVNNYANSQWLEAKEQIKNFVEKRSKGVRYDLDDPTGVGLKNAISDIVRYKQETESAYFPVISDVSMLSPTRTARIVNNLHRSGIYKGGPGDENAITKQADRETAINNIRDHFEKNKTAGWSLQPVSREGRAYDIVDTKDGTYYIESTLDDQTMFAGANGLAQQMFESGEPVKELENGDLFMSFMGKDAAGRPGSHLAGIIKGGATIKAQKLLATTHKANINTLVKEGGLTEAEANKMLQDSEAAAVDGQPVMIKTKKGFIRIDAPVYTYKNMVGMPTLYTFVNMKDYPLHGVRDEIKGAMDKASDLSRPQRALDMWPTMDAKMRAGVQGQSDFDILQKISNDFLERTSNRYIPQN